MGGIAAGPAGSAIGDAVTAYRSTQPVFVNGRQISLEMYLIAEAGAPVEPGSGDVSDRFRDVSRNAWYHDAVQWAVDKGLMNGVSEDTFAPDGTATRAMVVTMLWRLAGEPAGSQPAPFTDVSSDAWYADAVAWAAQTAAVNGTSGLWKRWKSKSEWVLKSEIRGPDRQTVRALGKNEKSLEENMELLKQQTEWALDHPYEKEHGS